MTLCCRISNVLGSLVDLDDNGLQMDDDEPSDAEQEALPRNFFDEDEEDDISLADFTNTNVESRDEVDDTDTESEASPATATATAIASTSEFLHMAERSQITPLPTSQRYVVDVDSRTILHKRSAQPCCQGMRSSQQTAVFVFAKLRERTRNKNSSFSLRFVIQQRFVSCV